MRKQEDLTVIHATLIIRMLRLTEDRNDIGHGCLDKHMRFRRLRSSSKVCSRVTGLIV